MQVYLQLIFNPLHQLAHRAALMRLQMKISVSTLFLLVEEGEMLTLWNQDIVDEVGAVEARQNRVASYLLRNLLSIVIDILYLLVLSVIQQDPVPNSQGILRARLQNHPAPVYRVEVAAAHEADK